MNPRLKKLLAYSSNACVFLLPSSKSDAQVIYHNIDPDKVFEDDGSVDIDFNDDGIYDIHITASFGFFSSWSSGGYSAGWGGSLTVRITNFNAVISNPTYPDSYGALDLQPGFSINSAGNWNSASNIKLVEFYSYMADIYDDSINDFYGSNKYIGVKFLIGTEVHFGWVRLSITNNGNSNELSDYTVAIQDYAFEASPSTTLVIEDPTASIAEHVFMADVYDYQNAHDFKIQFAQALNESTVSVYRIFICPYATPLPSLSLLESLPSDRYMEVLPAGTATYEVNLPTTMTDINGESIQVGYPHYYRALIVSLADGVLVDQNNVSVPSNPVLNKATQVPSPYDLEIVQLINQCDITSFSINFHKANNESYIAEYRVYILNDDHDLIAENDTSYFISVIPNGSNTYTVSPDSDLHIFEDTLPILFQNYYTEIMTIGDSIHTSIASFRSSRYTYSYYGDLYGSEVEFYCSQYNHTPAISLIDFTKTPADIRVQFNGPENLNQISEYRIFIVPEADVAGFTPEVAEHIPWTSYYQIKPPVTDLDIVLPADLSDINGSPIALDSSYAIMIALYNKSIPPKISVSLPSEIFKFLSDESNIPLPHSYIYENNLYVLSAGNLPYLLNLYNLAGEKVVFHEITSPITVIDLSDLPKGIYIIKGTNADEMPANKIFVGHAGY